MARDGTHVDFRASRLIDIPPPSVRELRVIFRDIDWRLTGRATAAAVGGALEVNALDLSKADVDVMLRAMEALTAQLDAAKTSAAAPVADAALAPATCVPAPSPGGICFEAFACCLHAASIQHREVLPSTVYAVFPDAAFTAEMATGLLRVRRSVWLLLEDPLSSPLARAIACAIITAILLSTISFCVETLPGIHARFPGLFRSIETACVILFTAEFVARFSSTPAPRSFFKAPLNVIDFLAIFPFYVEAIVIANAPPSLSADDAVEESQGAAILRAMRLVRIFRLVKMGRYVAWMRVFGKTLAASLVPLAMLLFVLSLAILLVSSAVYYAERGVWSPTATLDGPQEPGEGSKGYDDPVVAAITGNGTGAWINPLTGELSPFFSIPASFWWCIITLTTVGFGDITPVTIAGRCVAVCAFFFGIVLTAMPIAIITSNFHGEYDHMKRLQAIKLVRDSRRTLMTRLKAKELTSREHASTALRAFIEDVRSVDRTQRGLVAAGGGRAATIT